MSATSQVSKEAQSAAFRTMKWIPLTAERPTPGRMVLVKMADGNIEAASWSNERSDWIRAPFCAWGEPVAWAPLPLLGKTV